MRRLVQTAVLATLLAPALASAQPDRCLHERRGDEVIGALIGGGVGAIVGNLATHGGAGATAAGGVTGAAAGAVVGGASARCGQNRYGYYDDAGRWVPNRVTAYGYVNPDGVWVRGAPPVADQASDRWGADEGADTRAREQSLEAALERRMDDGVVSQRDGRRAMRDLRDIDAVDAAYRNGAGGRLTPDQRRDIEARLDALAARLGLGAAGQARAD
jgi:hypothetical protein